MEVLKLKYVRRLRRYHITSGSIILPEVLPYLRTSVRRFSIFEGTFVLSKVLSNFRTSVVVHVRRYCKLLLPYDDKCLFICVVRRYVLCTTVHVHVHVLYHICYLRTFEDSSTYLLAFFRITYSTL